MFKLALLIIMFSTISFANIVTKFTDPATCKACHTKQHKEWSRSLHSHSHEDSNELYKNVLQSVKSELNLSHEEIVIKCGTCHNPRLDIKNIDDNTILAKAFGVKTQSSQNLDIAMGAKHIKHGISCYICHNVDYINEQSSNDKRGYQILNWVKDDTIIGPYSNLGSKAVFHKSAKRDFFTEGNDLCLVCHQGKLEKSAFTSYNTGGEMDSVYNQQRCVDCHMGEISVDSIASNLPNDPSLRKNIRSHTFTGVRNSDILTTAISFDIKKVSQNRAKLTIENFTPHSVPSGFSGRSLVAEIAIMKNGSILNKQNIDMRAVYLNNFSQETFSYAAKILASDTRLNPLETRVFDVELPADATGAEISLVYYLLAPQLQDKFELKDSTYTKKYLISQKKFSL